MENTNLTNLTRTTSYMDTLAYTFKLPEADGEDLLFFEINTFKGIDYINSLGGEGTFIPTETYFSLLIELVANDECLGNDIIELIFNLEEWLQLHSNLKNILSSKSSFKINKTDDVNNLFYSLNFKWDYKRNGVEFVIKPKTKNEVGYKTSFIITTPQLEELLNLKFN